MERLEGFVSLLKCRESYEEIFGHDMPKDMPYTAVGDRVNIELERISLREGPSNHECGNVCGVAGAFSWRPNRVARFLRQRTDHRTYPVEGPHEIGQ